MVAVWLGNVYESQEQFLVIYIYLSSRVRGMAKNSEDQENILSAEYF